MVCENTLLPESAIVIVTEALMTSHLIYLSRYFQTVMWLGRIDFAVAGGPFARCPGFPNLSANPRETAGAVILWDLLNQSGGFETWAGMEQVIETFVGWTDSMTFAQLGAVLSGAGIHSLKDLPDWAAVERLQVAILSGQAGEQNIRSDFCYAAPSILAPKRRVSRPLVR